MQPHPWNAHYPDGITWNEAFHGRPLHTLLEDAAARWPNTIALDFMGKHYSYATLQSMVDRIAGGLQGMGVGKGTRVGLFMPNCRNS